MKNTGQRVRHQGFNPVLPWWLVLVLSTLAISPNRHSRIPNRVALIHFCLGDAECD